MSFQVILTVPAEDDLRTITRWLSKTAPRKIDKWQAGFWDALASLEELPARCPLIKDETHIEGLRHLLFNKYRIVFSIGDGVVLVVRVRHQSQAPLTADDI